MQELWRETAFTVSLAHHTTTMQKIFISDAISSATVDAVRFQIDDFDRALPLMVELNSDGGSVADGVAIYNLLRGWAGGLEVQVVGWALSIASVILQAGTKRSAHESALIMVHAPWTSSTGNATAMRTSAELLDQVGQTMLTIYRRTGQSDAIILGWLDGTDHWFTAAEALAIGLIDNVIAATETQPAIPANAKAARHPIPPVFSQRIFNMTTTPAHTNPEAIRAAAVLAEGQRRNEIRASFAKFADRDGVAAVQFACENDPNCTPEAAGLKLLAQLGKDSSPVSGHYRPSYSGESRSAEFRAAATDTLLARAGIKVADPHPSARDLQRYSIVALAESVLSMAGKLDRNMTAPAIISAALSTDDFPLLLSNTANKALSLGYGEGPSGHTLFTGERDVVDFKTNTLVNLSEAPGLEEVREYAEYRNGAMSESASTFKLATFGKILQISRQMLINDDLGAFTRLPQSFGAAARRLEADHVFGLLTANGVLGDGVALFHADHGNLGAAAALTVTSLATARTAMRKQRGIGGLAYVDPQPKFLIVPVALETVAELIIASLVDPSKSNSAPNAEFIKNLSVIADPRLDADSTTAWYLSASPQQSEGILRAYLSGQPRPFLDQDPEFKNDTFSYKVRLDFAAGVMDYRGLYKTASA